jgi:hypothetical protein
MKKFFIIAAMSALIFTTSCEDEAIDMVRGQRCAQMAGSAKAQ